MKRIITTLTLVCLLAINFGSELWAQFSDSVATLPYTPAFLWDNDHWVVRDVQDIDNQTATFKFSYRSDILIGKASPALDTSYNTVGHPCAIIAERKINTGNAPKIRFYISVDINGYGGGLWYYDYLSIFFVPEDTVFQPSASSNAPYYCGSNTSPYTEGLLYFNQDGRFAGVNDRFALEIDNPNPNSVYKLVLVWRNENDSEYAEGIAGRVTILRIESAYGINIGDVSVRDENKDNVLGDGKVSFDPTTNTLTLNNATTAGIDATYCKNLIINLQGENNVDYIHFNSSLEDSITITSSDGSGTLNTHSLSIRKGDLLIKNCNINLDEQAIDGIGGNGENANLTIDHANIHINSNNVVGAAIGGFSNITLTDVTVVQPHNYQIGIPSGGEYSAILNEYGTPAQQVIIKKGYDLYVSNGVLVSDLNKDDVLDDGKVSFDPTTRTLTLNNATIMGKVEGYNFTINLIGENTGTVFHFLYDREHNVTITSSDGSGTLNARGIAIVRGNLLIKDCNINLDCNNNDYGIAGVGNENLTIDGANISISNDLTCAIANFSSITLTNVIVIEPQNYQISSTPARILQEDGTPAKQVIIQKNDSGIEGIANNDEQINLYPNPTSDFFTIKSKKQPSAVIIYNQIGQIVKRITNVGSAKIYVGDLPSGTYHINITIDNASYKKLLIL